MFLISNGKLEMLPDFNCASLHISDKAV